MATITQSQFVTDFPAFADEGKFTTGMFNSAAAAASVIVSSPNWGELATRGTELVIAHFMTLAYNDAQANQSNGGTGVPGEAAQVPNKMKVDKVEVGFDSMQTAIKGGGMFNATSYGQEYLYYLEYIVGIGGTTSCGGWAVGPLTFLTEDLFPFSGSGN